MVFWYGFISTETYMNIKGNCLGDTPAAECKGWIQDAEDAIQNINIYDAFGVCYNNTPPSLHSSKTFELVKDAGEIKAKKRTYTAADLTPFLKNPIGGKGLRLLPPCVYAKPLLDYMNFATVKKQLNIPDAAPMWDMCNGDINENYVRAPEGSIGVYVALRDKYKVLIYSGDTDMAVPTYGTRDWIDNLNWPIVKQWKQFFVDNQVGGYVETRDGGKFTFATIHGAGHMAPQWRRGPTYHVIFNFINGKDI
jgi:Serine carboxypeptidase